MPENLTKRTATESKPKHTPGPWTIRRNSQGYPYQIEAPNGDKGPGGITSVTRWAAIALPSSPEGKANANLIAAAPDLLAVLENVKAKLDYLRNLWGDEGVTRSLCDQVGAAIAKATGQPA